METRIVHDEIKQNTPEWEEWREQHLGASDAPAMMGESNHVTRNELIERIALGIKKESSYFMKRIQRRGHALEVKARSAFAEIIVGDDLPATVMSYGILSASLDGRTPDGKIIMEHKSLNDGIRAAGCVEMLPLNYRIQMEQQLYVSGAEKCLFVASGDDGEEAVHYWYESDPVLLARILAGWDVLLEDAKNYQRAPAEDAAVIEVVADFPVISAKVDGAISIIDNFGDVETAVSDFLANKLIKAPVDDNDFANLDCQIKAIKRAEDMLKKAGDDVISQAEAVASFMRRKTALEKALQSARLSAEKIVKDRKASIKQDEIDRGAAEIQAYMNSRAKDMPIGTDLDALGRGILDLSDYTKNLKTIKSIKERISVGVAERKVTINQFVDDVTAKVKWLDETYPDMRMVVPDLARIINLVEGEFRAEVKSRIERYQAAEKARAEVAAARAAEVAKAPEPEPAKQVAPTATKQEKGFVEQLADKYSIELATMKKIHDEIVSYYNGE